MHLIFLQLRLIIYFDRYYSIIGKIYLFQSKKIILIFGAVILIYPLPSVSATLYGKIGVKKEEVLKYVEEKTPQYLVLFQEANCNSFITDFNALLALGTAILQISICYVFAFVYGNLIIIELRKVKDSISAATYAMQKHLFVALCFQALIPLIFLILPTSLLLMSVLFSTEDHLAYSEISIQLLGLHGSANGISVILFVRPYRDHFLGIVRSILKIKPTISDGPQITIIVTNTTDTNHGDSHGNSGLITSFFKFFKK